MANEYRLNVSSSGSELYRNGQYFGSSMPGYENILLRNAGVTTQDVLYRNDVLIQEGAGVAEAAKSVQATREQTAARQAELAAREEQQKFAKGSFMGREAQTRLYGGKPTAPVVGIEAAKAAEKVSAQERLGPAPGEVGYHATPTEPAGIGYTTIERTKEGFTYVPRYQPMPTTGLLSQERQKFQPEMLYMGGRERQPISKAQAYYPVQRGSIAEAYKPEMERKQAISWYGRLSPVKKGLALAGAMSFGVYESYLESKLGHRFDPTAGIPTVESVSMGKQTYTFKEAKPLINEEYKLKLYQHYRTEAEEFSKMSLGGKVKTSLYKGITSDVAVTGAGVLAFSGALGIAGKIPRLSFLPRLAGKAAIGYTAGEVGLKIAVKDYPSAIVEGGTFIAMTPLAMAGYRAGTILKRPKTDIKLPSLFRPSIKGIQKSEIVKSEITRREIIESIQGKKGFRLFEPSKPQPQKAETVKSELTRKELISSITGKKAGLLFSLPEAKIPKPTKYSFLTESQKFEQIRKELISKRFGKDLFRPAVSIKPKEFSFLTPSRKFEQIREEFISKRQGNVLFRPSVSTKPKEFSYYDVEKRRSILRRAIIAEREPQSKKFERFLFSEEATLLMPHSLVSIRPKFRVSRDVEMELRTMQRIRELQPSKTELTPDYTFGGIFYKKPVFGAGKTKMPKIFSPIIYRPTKTSYRNIAEQRHTELLKQVHKPNLKDLIKHRQAMGLFQGTYQPLGQMGFQTTDLIQSQLQKQFQEQVQVQKQRYRTIDISRPRERAKERLKTPEKPRILEYPKFKPPELFTRKKKRKGKKKTRSFLEISPIKSIKNMFKSRTTTPKSATKRKTRRKKRR